MKSLGKLVKIIATNYCTVQQLCLSNIAVLFVGSCVSLTYDRALDFHNIQGCFFVFFSEPLTFRILNATVKRASKCNGFGCERTQDRDKQV